MTGATVGRTKGLETHKSTAQQGKLKEGDPEPLGHLGRGGTRVGADGAGPAVAPPGAGVKRAGGAGAARAGTGPASSRPRPLARSPPPRAREGKGREGGRGGRRLGFPQPPGEELALWGPDSQPLELRGSLPPHFRTRSSSPLPLAWHPRGASSPQSCRVAPTTSPPAAGLLAQPTAFHPRCGGFAAPSRPPFISPPPLSRSTFPTRLSSL